MNQELNDKNESEGLAPPSWAYPEEPPVNDRDHMTETFYGCLWLFAFVLVITCGLWFSGIALFWISVLCVIGLLVYGVVVLGKKRER